MVRKDLYRIDIQDGLHLLVFHKMYNQGFGSAISFYINNFEYLKFDCFGEGKGHFHIYNGENSKLIYFVEQTALQQINKTIDELNKNLDYYLQQSNNGNIQNMRIVDKDAFSQHLQTAKQKMMEYEDTHYSKLRVV